MTAAKRVAFGLFILFFLLAQPELARAKTLRVGNGTAASCTEDALRSALTFAEGARNTVIQFNCGVAPVTIAVTAGLTVPDSTTINSNGLITLDGQSANAAPILHVEPGSSVAVRNLIVSRGVFPTILNEGALVVSGCTLSGNAGAIVNQGTLTVLNSTFSQNLTGIQSVGVLAISSSTFTENFPALFAQGTLTVAASAFYRNQAANGATIWADQGVHTISNSIFAHNFADESGAAILVVRGTLTLTNSIITQNIAGFGPVSNILGTLTITNTAITQNTANFDGGAIDNSSGTLVVKNSIISNNRASSSGGGISTGGGTATIQGTTITRSVAGATGGGIYNFSGTLALRDSAVTNNVASDGGGIENLGVLQTRGDTVVANITPNDIAP